jgi:hypothetical protein
MTTASTVVVLAHAAAVGLLCGWWCEHTLRSAPVPLSSSGHASVWAAAGSLLQLQQHVGIR